MVGKFLTLICSTLFLTSSLNALYLDKETADRIKKNTDAIIAKDLNSKELIFSKDATKRNQPASLTKIMTAILAIESGRMNNIVTITKPMISVEPTKAGLRLGEKFYLKDLVKAAMVMSANDAAMAIGIYLGDGNIERFSAIMNQKAKKIGMKNTHFTNPCGFDIGEHYSTAQDLLVMSEYAIKNSAFNEMAKLKRHDFRSLNTKRHYAAYTHNKLLSNYKYAVGIKTGFTQKAGPCLIARAKDGKKDILVVMLNSEQRWKDVRLLLDEVMPSLTNTKTASKTTVIKKASKTTPTRTTKRKTPPKLKKA